MLIGIAKAKIIQINWGAPLKVDSKLRNKKK